MNPFITYTEKNEDGILEYFVLQKAFPHYCGKVVGETSPGIWFAGIAGYSLYVQFNGTIRGNFIPDYRGVAEEIQDAMDAMANWYLSEIITPKKDNYKKLVDYVSSTIK